MVSATISVSTKKPVTNPAYLVEIGFQPALRFATHETVMWQGVQWVAGGITAEDVSANNAKLTLRNADNSISALVLTHKIADVPVTIYAWYDGDAEQVFYGTPEEVPEIGERVVLPCRAHTGASLYPTDRISAPQFNHITRSGTTIRWGSGTLELEAQQQ